MSAPSCGNGVSGLGLRVGSCSEFDGLDESGVPLEPWLPVDYGESAEPSCPLVLGSWSLLFSVVIDDSLLASPFGSAC